MKRTEKHRINDDEDSQIDLGVQLKSVRFYNDVNDYHRYHFPMDGTVLEVRKIDALDAVGGVISWDRNQKKYVLWDENPGWQSIETRDCLILDIEYGKVAILPIGMSQVSSCNREETVKPGVSVSAGDPMGYFLFGGSDIVMIFQEGAELSLEADHHVLMGEPYADIE